MILTYALAAYLGGILTAAMLWESAGPALALALAPFGGSALALCAALLIFARRAPDPTGRAGSATEPRHWWRLVR